MEAAVKENVWSNFAATIQALAQQCDVEGQMPDTPCISANSPW